MKLRQMTATDGHLSNKEIYRAAVAACGYGGGGGGDGGGEGGNGEGGGGAPLVYSIARMLINRERNKIHDRLAAATEVGATGVRRSREQRPQRAITCSGIPRRRPQ